MTTFIALIGAALNALVIYFAPEAVDNKELKGALHIVSSLAAPFLAYGFNRLKATFDKPEAVIRREAALKRDIKLIRKSIKDNQDDSQRLEVLKSQLAETEDQLNSVNRDFDDGKFSVERKG